MKRLGVVVALVTASSGCADRSPYQLEGMVLSGGRGLSGLVTSGDSVQFWDWDVLRKTSVSDPSRVDKVRLDSAAEPSLAAVDDTTYYAASTWDAATTSTRYMVSVAPPGATTLSRVAALPTTNMSLCGMAADGTEVYVGGVATTGELLYRTDLRTGAVSLAGVDSACAPALDAKYVYTLSYAGTRGVTLLRRARTTQPAEAEIVAGALLDGTYPESSAGQAKIVVTGDVVLIRIGGALLIGNKSKFPNEELRIVRESGDPPDFAVDGDTVYWTSPASDEILRARVIGGELATPEVWRRVRYPTHVAATGGWVLWYDGEDQRLYMVRP